MLNSRVVAATIVVVTASFSGLMIWAPQAQVNSPELMSPYPAWLTNSNNTVSVTQLAQAYASHNLTLELPSQLPSGLTLTSIHVKNAADPSGYAMLTYSATGITDFRYAEMVIQVIPGNQPSASELTSIVANSNGKFQQLNEGGTTVLLNPQAPNGDSVLQKQFGSMPYAMYWKNGVYFQIRVYHPLTTDALLTAITTLKPVSSSVNG